MKLIFARNLEEKLKFIETEILPAQNEKRRGGRDKVVPKPRVHQLIFNPYDDKTPGELSELRFEITNRHGIEAYLGELADLTYNSLRLDHDLLLPVFAIGKDLGFRRIQIAQGCIIKYVSRWLIERNPAHERILLNGYLESQKEPQEKKCREALEKIDNLFKKADKYFHQ